MHPASLACTEEWWNCISVAWQGQHSHVITAFMLLPLKQTKLFSEFPTEGKFSSWLFSRTKGWAVPEKLFAQAEQEQQQAANPFTAWTRAMEAEEKQIPTCIAGNLQGSVITFS